MAITTSNPSTRPKPSWVFFNLIIFATFLALVITLSMPTQDRLFNSAYAWRAGPDLDWGLGPGQHFAPGQDVVAGGEGVAGRRGELQVVIVVGVGVLDTCPPESITGILDHVAARAV